MRHIGSRARRRPKTPSTRLGEAAGPFARANCRTASGNLADAPHRPRLPSCPPPGPPMGPVDRPRDLYGSLSRTFCTSVANLSDPDAAVAWLRSPQAIRERCAVVLATARGDRLDHFALRPERLEPVADYVAETIAANYPDLDVPTHSRWRHFAVGGRDRWAELAARLDGTPREELARVRFDLAVTSVLLDAGAGADWRYREPTSGEIYVRSEGLAVASLHLFSSGMFSTDPARPLRADAAGLAGGDRSAPRRGFPGRAGQSPGRARRPRGVAARSRRGARSGTVDVRRRSAAGRRAVRLFSPRRGFRGRRCHGDPGRRARGFGANLAWADRVGRGQSRRRLAPSGGRHR